MARRFTVIAILAGLVSALAPAQNTRSRNQPQSDAPTAVVVEAPKTIPGAVDSSTTGAPIDPSTYVIGPLDILLIKVFRDTDFTGQYGVRPDGRITLSLVGDMQAAGLTPERLAAQVKQALSNYIINPDVNVSVLQVNSKTYSVTGEVNRPGRYPLLLPTHVFDAINDAGGFREFANKKDITILRGDQRLKFNYEDVRKGKKLEQNVLLENGDTILIR